MKRAIIVLMAAMLTAFACAQTTGTEPAAKGAAKASGYQWAVSSGGQWTWVDAPLSAEERESLNQALQKPGVAGPENYVLMIANGEKLAFQADTEKKEPADRVAKQALFKTGDQRFRVVPKGDSYMILKGRLGKTAA